MKLFANAVFSVCVTFSVSFFILFCYLVFYSVIFVAVNVVCESIVIFRLISSSTFNINLFVLDCKDPNLNWVSVLSNFRCLASLPAAEWDVYSCFD